jgi:hypothetical protein
MNAIIEFKTVTDADDVPEPSRPTLTVSKFAAQNSEFFHAPKLADLLREKFDADNT